MEVEKRSVGNEFADAVSKTLSSYLLVPILFVFGYLCWYFKLSILCVAAFDTVAVLTMLFCKNIRTLFVLIIYIPYFVQNLVDDEPNLTFYICFIAIAVVALLGLTVKTVILKGKNYKKGGLFLPLIVMAIAFALGGAGRVDFFTALLTGSIVIALLLVYLAALNNTEDMLKYLSYVFVLGSIIIFAEIFTFYIQSDNFWEQVKKVGAFYIFVECINTASIVVALGIFGCFNLGRGKKYDIFAFLLSEVIFGFVLLTRSRIVTFVAAVAIVIVFIFMAIYSKHKKLFIITGLTVTIAAIAAALLSVDNLSEVIEIFITKNGYGINGRGHIWDWCLIRIKERPMFGYGFLSEEPMPGGVRDIIITLILAHNTLLQYLTSLGIVGTLLMGYFIFGKYFALYKTINKETFFADFIILSIAIIGMVDQSPSMDPTIFLIPLILIAAIECAFNKKRTLAV